MGVIMKKKLTTILSTAFMITLIAGSTTLAGTSNRETVTLSKNQVWKNASVIVSRSKNNSTLEAQCYSVYPTNGGTDKFTRVQTRAYTTTGLAMTDTYTLNETNSAVTILNIKEGYLSHSPVQFKFRGNDPDYAAKADVYYYGN